MTFIRPTQFPTIRGVAGKWAVGVLSGWECTGNRRSGVAPAIRHILVWCSG